MAGRQISWLVILVVVVLNLIAFGLAIGGEVNRSKASGSEETTQPAGDYIFCKYNSDKASGFGAGAMLFLLVGFLVVMGVTKCLCCGGPYRPGAARVFAVIFFIVVWICFLLAELLLLSASVKNTVHTKRSFYLGSDQITCKQLRKGIFNAGAAFSFLTMLSSVAYYTLITKANDFVRDFKHTGIGMSEL